LNGLQNCNVGPRIGGNLAINSLLKNKIDEEIRKIMDKPSIGSEKKGDLRAVYVHRGAGSHFKFHANQNAKRT